MTIRVYMLPTPEQAETDRSNAIHQIVLRLRDHLPRFGVEIQGHPQGADLVAGHAGQTDGVTVVDVAHVHGLYPTAHHAQFETANWHWAANKHVIDNVRSARHVTVPSEWVADLFRRDMHLSPSVIGWAIDPSEWEPDVNQGYVLWNKTRSDGVCSPKPLVDLAVRAPNHLFVSTFGTGTNVRVIGRQTFDAMKTFIREANVYLATTLETFGIGTLEAMACGVPVLGYRWGGTADLVEHGVTGYLVEPGDVAGLRTGLDYCIKHRDILGKNARLVASRHTWDRVAEQFATLYQSLVVPRPGPKVSVVIPCHNYEQYVGQAIRSVLSQVTSFDYELIVVLDRCTDQSERVVRETLHPTEPYNAKATVRWEKVDHGNPADTRNHGISLASGDYMVCLDADDALGDNRFLQTLADELDRDRSLGIVFTAIRVMDSAGNLGRVSDWPSGYDFEQQRQRRNQVPTCCMFRREAWSRSGGYRARYAPAEDADLWLRMGALGYRAKQVTSEPWFVYRLHANSLSSVVRTGQKPEPDWVSDKPWTKDEQRPFASDGKPPSWSWPVRNYDRPKVSVIIPVGPYHVGYLPEALDSVEAQTERFWECVVVNDTGKPLDLPGYPWARIVDTGGEKGAAYARNRGVDAAKAPLVTFLDADDVLHMRFLELTLRQFNRSGRYIYTDWVSLSKDGQYETHVTPEFDPNDVFRKTSIHSINILIPRRDVLQVGGFDETMRTWEDVDLFMKLAAAGLCGTRLGQPLVLYRYKTGQLRENGEQIKDNLVGLLRERYADYIEGRKMCGCNGGPKPKIQGAVESENGNESDMVRIEYVGGTGQVHVVGLVTKQQYGRRSNGDIFYVYRVDQLADPEQFVPITEVVGITEGTPVPGEPVLL